ncbi:hypothetical protein XENTR_v10000473 [Xenopus tropicalis]|nr:hypothetical protein XENTR_v10000473 [Xenopus tropicalis]
MLLPNPLDVAPSGLKAGKTDQTLRLRMDGHRSAISTAFRDGVTNKPVAKHFLEQGHRLPTFRYIAIDHVPLPRRGGDRSRLLLQRETFWIKTLNTLSPFGLNEYCSFSCFLNQR